MTFLDPAVMSDRRPRTVSDDDRQLSENVPHASGAAGFSRRRYALEVAGSADTLEQYVKADWCERRRFLFVQGLDGALCRPRRLLRRLRSSASNESDQQGLRRRDRLPDRTRAHDRAQPAAPEGIASFLDSAEGDFWPQSGYRVLEVAEGERATVVFAGSEEFPGLRFMSVEWTSEGWEWAGASAPIDCGLVIEPSTNDDGVVDWVIDPDSDPPAPETTSLVLLATERGCAGGAPMGDRLNDPQITMTADLILIQLTVEPQTGEQTCPDNPAQLIDVQLPEPLGQRGVSDARATSLGDLDDVLNRLIADS